MKLQHLLICLPILSCSASDAGSTAQEGALHDDAGEVLVRIDGSTEGDGIFASEAEQARRRHGTCERAQLFTDGATAAGAWLRRELA